MKKYLFVMNLILILISGCKKDINYPGSANNLLSFAFQTAANPAQITNDLSCIISDSIITGVTGAITDKSALVATFATTDAVVTVNGVVQQSGVTKNDFTNPVVYTVTAPAGNQKKYTMKLASFTGLPVLYLTTEAPVVSKDDYVNGTMKIDGNMDYTDGLYDGKIQIKGRGNSTWYQPKKPYKIKLDTKSAILGMPADKEWALLANYLDKSLIRNDVAFELSEEMGLNWTPRRRFVEVFINGAYNGNYLLTETVEIGKDRVNIDTKNGGYLLEVNNEPQEDDPRIQSDFGPVDVKEGTIPIDTMKNQINAVYAKLVANQFDKTTGYQEEFDLNAFVSWYLVNEIMLNNDAIFYSSVFIQKDNDTSKIKMGPVWDFDLSSGNVSWGQTNPEGWYLKQGNFVNVIWNDPLFQAAVKAKWNKYRSQIMSISQYIVTKGQDLGLSANENFKIWDILNAQLGNTAVFPGTYQGEVDYLRDWLNKRIQWMDGEINK